MHVENHDIKSDQGLPKDLLCASPCLQTADGEVSVPDGLHAGATFSVAVPAPALEARRQDHVFFIIAFFLARKIYFSKLSLCRVCIFFHRDFGSVEVTVPDGVVEGDAIMCLPLRGWLQNFDDNKIFRKIPT